MIRFPSHVADLMIYKDKVTNPSSSYDDLSYLVKSLGEVNMMEKQTGSLAE